MLAKVSMPFKTGLGTAGGEKKESVMKIKNVSMPFKTGLGTAGIQNLTKIYSRFEFQCPLRRAWVLRGLHIAATSTRATGFNAL